MNNPIFNFLSKHQNHNLDKLIDISKLFDEFVYFTPDVKNAIYTMLKDRNDVLKYEGISVVNAIGIERTYELLHKATFNRWDECESFVRAIVDIADKKSQKYYIKKLLIAYSSYYIAYFEMHIEKLYRFGLMNTLCEMYKQWHINPINFVESIFENDISNFACVRILLQTVWKNKIDVKFYCTSHIRNVKFSNKHFRDDIESIELLQFNPDIKLLVFAKNAKLPHNTREIHKSFGLIIRKHSVKSTKFRITEKIMQLFTTRNMSKLILYYV